MLLLYWLMGTNIITITSLPCTTCILWDYILCLKHWVLGTADSIFRNTLRGQHLVAKEEQAFQSRQWPAYSTYLESLMCQASPGGVLVDYAQDVISCTCCLCTSVQEEVSNRSCQSSLAELSDHTDATTLPSTNSTLSPLLTVTLRQAVRLLSPYYQLTSIQNQSSEISYYFS